MRTKALAHTRAVRDCVVLLFIRFSHFLTEGLCAKSIIRLLSLHYYLPQTFRLDKCFSLGLANKESENQINGCTLLVGIF